MESGIVKQGAGGDVDIGMGVGDFLDLAEDPRGYLSQRGDDPEVRVIGAEFRPDLELQSRPWVLLPQDCMPESIDRTASLEFPSNEGLDLHGIIRSDPLNEF